MSLLFLEAIAPWGYNLAKALSARTTVAALSHIDWRAQRRLCLASEARDGAMEIHTRVFPPGFAGTLAPLFAPMIARNVKRSFARLQGATGECCHVIAPYPHDEPWVRGIPDTALVYYNFDDYELYNPPQAARIRRREDALIARAALTVCVAHHQAERFRARFPERAASIHHLPHGVLEQYMQLDPAQPPRPGVVGYVGNLTDRVDWEFVDRTVQLAPELSFEFVGHRGAENTPWAKLREQVAGRPNVHFPGPVPQAQVYRSYSTSAVNWMPYDTRHPFNIASSPTKIFDALASGRPFVSTAIPEAMLYPDHIGIADTPEQAAAMLRSAAPHDVTRALAIRRFAAGQTWQHRAEQLLALLEEAA